MVYFSCNTCGSSIKKNQVEKHCNTKCRNCRVLSCLDCGKDFIGEAYKEHTQCITEDEKYSAKGSQPKPSQDARGKKQQEWMKAVKTLAEENKDTNSKVQKALKILSEQENVPRKRSKLENFLNCRKEKISQETIDELWNLLSLAQERLKSSRDGSGATETVPFAGQETGEAATQEGEKLSKKKRKAERRRKQMKVEKKDAKVEKDDDEEEKGKKKKKQRHGVPAEDEQGEEEVVKDKKKKKHEEGEQGDKKKKKRKHFEETEDSLLGDDVKMNGEGGQAEGEHEADDEGESRRRKKKRKNCVEDSSNEGEERRKKEKLESVEDSGQKQHEQELHSKGDTADAEQETETSMQEDNSGLVTTGAGSAKKFKWDTVIRAALESKDGEISIKKLRKKVIAEYCALGGDGKGEKSMEKLWALFNKKLKKNPEFKVSKDKVKLVK